MGTSIKNNKKTKLKGSKSSADIKTKEEMFKLFFGKLPKIEDGLQYQKKVRSEYNTA